MATLEFGTGNATNYTTLFTVELDTRGMDAVTLADTCLAQARLHVNNVTSVTPTKAAIAGKNGRVYVHVALAPKDKPAKTQAQAGTQAPVGMGADIEAAFLVEYGVAPDMDAAREIVGAKRAARRAEIEQLQDNVLHFNERIAALERDLKEARDIRDEALAQIAALARKA